MKNSPLVHITNYTMRKDFDCGPTAVATWLSAYNLVYKPGKLLKIFKTTEEDGTSWRRMNRFLKGLGVFVVEQSFSFKKAETHLKKELPLFICWDVLYRKKFISHYSLIINIDEEKVIILDPEDYRKFTSFELDGFKKVWAHYRYWSVRLVPMKKKLVKEVGSKAAMGFEAVPAATTVKLNHSMVKSWIAKAK